MSQGFAYTPDLYRTIRWALPSVWSGSRVKGILKGITENLQLIEDTTLNIRTSLQFDTASGPILNIWGEIFGESRANLDDELYRKIIQAKVQILSSRGTTQETRELLEIVSDGEVGIEPRFPAGYRYTIAVEEPLDDAEIQRINRLLNSSTPVGVGFGGIEAAPLAFRLDEPSLDSRKLGRII